MTESCISFNPHHWKPNICRNCTKRREDHPNVAILSEIHTPDVQMSTSHQVADDNGQSVWSATPVQTLSQVILPPCQYGLDCYRTNPDHFEHYSHPPNHKRKCTPNSASRAVIPLIVDDERVSSKLAAASWRETRKTSDERKHEELGFIELVEKRVQELIDNSQFKDQEINKLCQDQLNMINYHQNLEKALADELEYRERHEFEQQHSLVIPRQRPSYWGPNAFSESYREIQISNESPEFVLINSLLNSTIAIHENYYGTIYGKDPTEFVLTGIKRIQNIKLWNEYCYKKVRLYLIAKGIFSALIRSVLYRHFPSIDLF
jgi:hemerythrin